MAQAVHARHISRDTIGEFLYAEAALLLDEWHLQECLALLTDNATSKVPSADTPDGDARTSPFMIAGN
jgi:3-phenylpropionate/cinnamic acid dioxygenase small subunit